MLFRPLNVIASDLKAFISMPFLVYDLLKADVAREVNHSFIQW